MTTETREPDAPEQEQPEAAPKAKAEKAKSVDQPAPAPAGAPPQAQGGRHHFTREDAFKQWYVVARNSEYAGETEGFQFSNGIATIAPLSQRASEERVEERVAHLYGLENYPYSYRTKNARGAWVTRTIPSYRVLDQEQYDAEFADDGEESDELPDDF